MNHPLTVATFNVHHRRPNGAIRADVIRVIDAGADVIALQEMGGHQQVLHELPPSWRWHVGAGGAGEGRADTPILWDTTQLVMVRRGVRQVSAPATVEDAAGGTTVPEKTVTWVTLRHRTSGFDLAVLNTHAVPSVEGVEGHPAPHHPKRLRLYADLMRVLTQMVNMRGGRLVFVCGDLNVDYKSDAYVQDRRFPFRVFEKVKVHASYRHLGVPGVGRLIDYVAHTIDARLMPMRQQLLDGCGSDHRPLLVWYQLGHDG